MAVEQNFGSGIDHFEYVPAMVIVGSTHDNNVKWCNYLSCLITGTALMRELRGTPTSLLILVHSVCTAC